jgi:hypothetical protein
MVTLADQARKERDASFYGARQQCEVFRFQDSGARVHGSGFRIEPPRRGVPKE